MSSFYQSAAFFPPCSFNAVSPCRSQNRVRRSPEPRNSTKRVESTLNRTGQSVMKKQEKIREIGTPSERTKGTFGESPNNTDTRELGKTDKMYCICTIRGSAID